MPIRPRKPDAPIKDIPIDPADWNLPVKGEDGKWHYRDRRTKKKRDEDALRDNPPREVHVIPTDATEDEISAFVRAIKGE